VIVAPGAARGAQSPPALGAPGSILDPGAAGPASVASPLEGPRADREADLFWRAPARGVVETVGLPGAQPPGPEQLAEALELWRARMRANERAACLHLVAEAASLPAAELYALPFVPAEIARERERFGAYATRTMGGNLLGDLIQEEVRRRERVVAIDAEGVCLAAFASRVPYQLLIAPRTPAPRFQDDGPTCAALLADVLARLRARLGEPLALQLWVRTAPLGAEHFAWRIDLLPRSLPGGLERGAGVAVSPLAPETAAEELRRVGGI
jgi:UDPglucose--hexose-1-phosphate uridylyltransferase